jgi:hypothetical protein
MDGRTLFDPPTDDEGDASDENGEDDVAPTIAPRRFFDAESEESDADAVEDHLRAMGYIESPVGRVSGRFVETDTSRRVVSTCRGVRIGDRRASV